MVRLRWHIFIVKRFCWLILYYENCMSDGGLCWTPTGCLKRLAIWKLTLINLTQNLCETILIENEIQFNSDFLDIICPPLIKFVHGLNKRITSKSNCPGPPIIYFSTDHSIKSVYIAEPAFIWTQLYIIDRYSASLWIWSHIISYLFICDRSKFRLGVFLFMLLLRKLIKKILNII